MNSEATPNPLLDLSDLPLFDAITPDHVEPAITLLLKEADMALETVTQETFPADWAAMASALDVATERLGRAWGAGCRPPMSGASAWASRPPIRRACMC